MNGNDLAFVRQTMRLLHDRGITTWLFGGWAEELLHLIPPRPHHDLDLLYPARDFTEIDVLLAASQDLTEIPAKHLPHKRAFLRLGIMTELILLRQPPDQPGSPTSGIRSATCGQATSWPPKPAGSAWPAPPPCGTTAPTTTTSTQPPRTGTQAPAMTRLIRP